MNLLAELQAFDSAAEFRPYFVALDKCRNTQKDFTHDHHILPRKQFPQFAECPENLIAVSPQEHAWLHRVLENCCPKLKAPPTALIEGQKDAIAKSLATHRKNGTGFCGKELHTLGGFSAQATHKRNRTGFYSKTHQAAAGRASQATQRRKGIGCYSAARLPHIRWHVNRGIVNRKCVHCCLEKRA